MPLGRWHVWRGRSRTTNHNPVNPTSQELLVIPPSYFHTSRSITPGCAHLDVLKLEQALTDVKITRHLTREPSEHRPQKWAEHDQRLNTVIEIYIILEYATTFRDLTQRDDFKLQRCADHCYT